MAFSQEQKTRIAEALNKKAPVAHCPLCGAQQWILSDGFTMLIMQDTPQGIVIGGPAMPCISIVCGNCGNTHLLNIFVLGLGDMIPPSTAVKNG